MKASGNFVSSRPSHLSRVSIQKRHRRHPLPPPSVVWRTNYGRPLRKHFLPASSISVRANRRCNYAFQLMKQSPPRPCYLVVFASHQTAQEKENETQRERERERESWSARTQAPGHIQPSRRPRFPAGPLIFGREGVAAQETGWDKGGDGRHRAGFWTRNLIDTACPEYPRLTAPGYSNN